MSPRRFSPPSARTAVSYRGGCLSSGFWLPPLAVIAIGLLMAVVTMGSSVSSMPVDVVTPVSLEVQPVESRGQLAALFTPEVQWWAGYIYEWAAETGLDPNLIATVMQIESCGDPQARSRSGAMGLFQVMPYHFNQTDDPIDFETNAARGLSYLSLALTAASGEVRLALAGYNGGIGVISRLESTWAAETQRYVYWGTGIYQDALQGNVESRRLQEWLSKGGASLCLQAHERLNLP